MESKQLTRGLKPRHVELIALGGTIGVGLFMGSASTIKWAGPSVLLAYLLAGIIMFFVMRIMGEMLILEPVTGSFATFAHKYISPLARFFDRLELLVLMGYRRDGGGYCDWGVCGLLVP